jgi:hypothetical protein
VKRVLGGAAILTARRTRARHTPTDSTRSLVTGTAARVRARALRARHNASPARPPRA